MDWEEAQKMKRLEAENVQLRNEKAELVRALENIKNPLPMLQSGVPKEYNLEGHTETSLLNDVEFYKNIARTVLVKVKED